MQKDEIDVRLAEVMPCLESFLRIIDKAQVDDPGVVAFELGGNSREVAVQAVLKARKLGPIGIETDAEKSY